MNKRVYLYCVLFIAAAAVLLPQLSCRREVPTQATATFVVGDVMLFRQNEAPRQVRHGDRLVSNDTIKTGKDSLFAFQVKESAVIRITANSRVLIADILSDKSNRLVLDYGRVLASVKKIGKETEGFEVQTKTTVAAVRGTEFSVNYEMGRTVVAVKEGAVQVQRVTEDRSVVEETMVKGGNAAVITKTTSQTRPVNKDEEDVFVKVEKINVIEGVHKKSESDLKDNEQKVLHGDQAVVPVNQEGQTAGVDEQSLADGASRNSSRYGPKRAVIWTSRWAYRSKDRIIVGFKNLPESKYCWISVAKAGATGKNFIRYDWTRSRTSGQMVFEGLGLEPGNYEARAHFSRSTDISKRTFFRVQ